MNNSIFTTLVEYSMEQARSQFADHLANESTEKLIYDNPEAFTEPLSFGASMILMSEFMDCVLQNYHSFLCTALKAKGIDISDLEELQRLIND